MLFNVDSSSSATAQENLDTAQLKLCSDIHSSRSCSCITAVSLSSGSRNPTPSMHLMPVLTKRLKTITTSQHVPSNLLRSVTGLTSSTIKRSDGLGVATDVTITWNCPVDGFFGGTADSCAHAFPLHRPTQSVLLLQVNLITNCCKSDPRSHTYILITRQLKNTFTSWSQWERKLARENKHSSFMRSCAVVYSCTNHMTGW